MKKETAAIEKSLVQELQFKKEIVKHKTVISNAIQSYLRGKWQIDKQDYQEYINHSKTIDYKGIISNYKATDGSFEKFFTKHIQERLNDYYLDKLIIRIEEDKEEVISELLQEDKIQNNIKSITIKFIHRYDIYKKYEKDYFHSLAPTKVYKLLNNFTLYKENENHQLAALINYIKKYLPLRLLNELEKISKEQNDISFERLKEQENEGLIHDYTTDPIAKNLFLEELKEKIKQLSDKEIRILTLKYKGYNQSEIAKSEDMTQSGISRVLDRIKTKLF